MKKPKKNPAAVALGRKGGEARAKALTPEQLSASARHALDVRYGKAKPALWYGLVALPADYAWKGTAHAAKVLDAATANSAEVLFWSQDRAAVVARSREADLRDRIPLIIEQNWNPRSLRIQREFKPDVDAQSKAVRGIHNRFVWEDGDVEITPPETGEKVNDKGGQS